MTEEEAARRHGDDEMEATGGRVPRWYHLRPVPRRRADLMGFNALWWVLLWLRRARRVPRAGSRRSGRAAAVHPAFACIIGLNLAVARGREQLAVGLMFGLGLLLGLAVAPVIADYAKANPSSLWQAAGATAAFVAAFGAYGYATRRDSHHGHGPCSGRCWH